MAAYENTEFKSDKPASVCQLYTGGYFDYLDPSKSVLNIKDIAHALANQCRFNGHTKIFYSVAEHSVLCYHYLSELKNEQDQKVRLSAKTLLYCLLHDAAEAVISDIPKPFKSLFPEIEKKEEEYLLAIFDLLELDLDDADKELVKFADRFMLLKEAKKLLEPCTRFRYVWGPWVSKYRDIYQEMMGNEDTVDDIFISGWTPEEAEDHFLSIFNDLKWQRP